MSNPSHTDAAAKKRGFKNLAHWKREARAAGVHLRRSLKAAKKAGDGAEVRRLQALIKLNAETLPA